VSSTTAPQHTNREQIIIEDAEAFAGPGGWDVAAAQLGIHLKGLEWDAAACATATAAGFTRLQMDVASAELPIIFPNGVRLVILSPPCQAFSAAGKGKGRAGAVYILMGVQLMAWGNDPVKVCQWVDEQLDDPRAALVLEPLRWVLETRPETIALEQVPAVLPLWEAMAVVFRNMGYSVWTGNLYAEQYDTPQTRKRAILVGSRVREVGRPAPVRRRFRKDRKTKKTNRYVEFKLDEPGLKPWISMADALHRNVSDPSGVVWQLRMNSAPHAAVRHLDEPSSTVFFGERVNAAAWEQMGDVRQANGTIRNTTEPAGTVTASMDNGNFRWISERPATTVQGDPRISEPGHRHRGPDCCSTSRDAGGIYQSMFSGESVRVTVQEAAVLQGFPANYPWQGNKGEQHRQVGDAIPPPLAWHVLRAAFGLPVMHYPGTEDL
jgi:DNA (cytosine-5)-methyltransferase 1